MRRKLRRNLLVCYDILLSLGSTITGSLMLQSEYGVFHEYPKEWLSILPFRNWITPGILIIVLFGLGNLLSAISALRKEDGRGWIMSAIMGIILFLCMTVQVAILEEIYLADCYILIVVIVQIYLSGRLFLSNKTNRFWEGLRNEQ